MFDVRNLYKTFGKKQVLQGVELNLKNGEIYTLLGQNGAGKTTFLNIVSGLISPDKNNTTVISIDGVNLVESPLEYKRKFGYVPAQPFFYEELTVKEFLDFVVRLYGMELEETEWREYLEIFSLPEDVPLSSLSFGQRQKVSIVIALLHSPRVLFLDEAMIGLDPQSVKFFKLFLNNLKNRGVSILFATHILEIAQILADRIGILSEGKILIEGTLEELQKRVKQENLEDIFLSLTGGEKYQQLVREVEKLFSEKDG